MDKGAIMSGFNSLSRRNAVKLCFSCAAATSALSGALSASQKTEGVTNVLFLVGDYWHNPITQEKNWQDVLRHTGWRLRFARATRFVTPEALADTDLFVVARYAKTNNLGWSPDEIVESRDDEEAFLTDERESAIIENVRRGMGLLAMHCAVWNGERKSFMDLLGIAEPHMHTKVQPTQLHNLDPEHPITRGVASAKLGEDEIFSADLVPGRSKILFNLKGEEQSIDTAGGWCHDFGAGRVVVLLPGHTPHPFHAKSFKEIMWRSAHWALKRDIAPVSFENGRPPEKSIY